MSDDRIQPTEAPAREPYQPPLLTKHQPLLAITGKSGATETKTGDKPPFTP